MHQPNPLWLCVSVCLLSPVHALHAQGVDTGKPAQIWQDQLRRLERLTPATPRTETPPAQAPQGVAPASVARVVFSEIQFSKSALLSEEALRPIGLRYVGRALQTSDIQAMLDDITALYREKGILTALPVLPQQDLNSGILKVLLVEGRLGRVTVRKPGDADPAWVERWFDLPPGEVVTDEALNNRLALFNASSDWAAQAEFVAGERFGVSDLAVDLSDLSRSQFWSVLEGTGGHSATPAMLALGWRWAPVSQVGGRVDAALVSTRQGKTLTAATSWPIGVTGWRLGLNGSVSRTRTVVASEVPNKSPLVLDGASSGLSAELGRTWILDRNWTLGSVLQWSHLTSRVSLAPTPLTDTLHRLSLTSQLQYEKGLQRASFKQVLSSSTSQNLRYHYLDLSAQAQTALDTQGQWLGRITAQARVASHGQSNATEQLTLGGAETVRGFDAGTLSGEKGHATQIELRYRPTPGDAAQTEIVVFTDAGQAWSPDARKRIASVGIGLQTRLSDRVGVDLSATRPLRATADQHTRLQMRLVGSW